MRMCKIVSFCLAFLTLSSTLSAPLQVIVESIAAETEESEEMSGTAPPPNADISNGAGKVWWGDYDYAIVSPEAKVSFELKAITKVQDSIELSHRLSPGFTSIDATQGDPVLVGKWEFGVTYAAPHIKLNTVTLDSPMFEMGPNALANSIGALAGVTVVQLVSVLIPSSHVYRQMTGATSHAVAVHGEPCYAEFPIRKRKFKEGEI